MPKQVKLKVSGLISFRYTEKELFDMAHGLGLAGDKPKPTTPKPVEYKAEKCQDHGVCTCGKHAGEFVPMVTKAEVVAWIRRYASLHSAKQQQEVDILRRKIESALKIYTDLNSAFAFARRYTVR